MFLFPSNSQSMVGGSEKSTSQHSSTGPSNNTGSTNLSNQFNNGGYSRPFQHIPAGRDRAQQESKDSYLGPWVVGSG